MSDNFFTYYERELLFIRQLAQDFAKQYPAAAGRLLLEQNRSADPHVERLIESFAFLTARVHSKLDDEFPELTDAILGVLYPHYLAPVPIHGDGAVRTRSRRAQLPQGFLIDKHSRLHTQPVGDLPCKFRTGYPVTLWPVELTNAKLQAPPFPGGLKPPPKTMAALRLQFECQAEMSFAELGLEKLRIYLSGDNQLISSLYQLIFNHTIQVAFRPLDKGTLATPVVLTPAQCISQVGFDREESLLPYPHRSFLGYRLLTEFFTFPNKFLFLDLSGWTRIREAKFGRKLEVILYLNRTSSSLEQGVDTQTFRLGCTPIINLFDQIAEPIQMTQSRYEYLLVPDVAHHRGLEVFSVDGVTNADPSSVSTTEYEPFYSFRHGKARDNQQAFWYATRRASYRENDRGTEVYLNFVDLAFNPRLPAESVMVVRTTCTNRDLPSQLQRAGDELFFELEAAAPLSRIRCLKSPTTPLRPPLRRGRYWRLISHLSLNHLSISDPIEGKEALQEILKLYDFSDPESGQQLSAVIRQLIDGILSVKTRRVVGRTGSETSSGFCRGIEITIDLDEQKYVGTGVFLLLAFWNVFWDFMFQSIHSVN